MPSPKIHEVAERARSSRFVTDVVGPKVAVPLSDWLRTTFDDTDPSSAPDPGSTATESRLSTSTEPGPTPPESSLPEATGPEATESTAAIVATEAAEPEPEPAEPIRGIKNVALALKDRVKDHNLVVVSGGIAFWGLLAIPAVLFSLVSIGGLVFDAETIKQQVEDNISDAPPEVKEIIGDQLEGVAGSSTGGLITGVVLGIVLALWTSSGAMAKVMSTLNTIYERKESRKFVPLRGTALGMTFGGIVFIVSTMFVLTALPSLLSRIEGVGGTAAWLFSLATYPVLALVMILGLGLLYRFGPNATPTHKWRPFNWGATIATILWVVAIVGFSVYTTTLAGYNETYGALGGIVILLMFLLITALVVLIGAEIDAIRNPR